MNISVVVTTYDRSDFAKRAIKSVINQTYQPEEIIVIEDASETDLKKWLADNHLEVKYYRNKKNFGLAASRNNGTQFSKCEWIAFLDDDDEWLPARLDEQVKCFQNLSKSEKKDLACIQVGVKRLDNEKNTIGIHLPVNDGNLKESIIKDGASTPSSSFLFKREALEKVGGFDKNLSSGIDHDIWMKLAAAGYSTKALMKPLVIVYKENLETMMTNSDQRIKGITQYVNKWLPTYMEWFGKLEGKQYANDYYTLVISRLAGEKLAKHQFAEFINAVKSIYRFTGSEREYLFKALNKSLKIYAVARIPFIRKMVEESNLKRLKNL